MGPSLDRATPTAPARGRSTPAPPPPRCGCRANTQATPRNARRPRRLARHLARAAAIAPDPTIMPDIAAANIIHRTDYTPPAFLIDAVELDFDLRAERTLVTNRMKLRRNPAARAVAATPTGA